MLIPMVKCRYLERSCARSNGPARSKTTKQRIELRIVFIFVLPPIPKNLKSDPSIVLWPIFRDACDRRYAAASLELPRGQPSAVDETREERQKDCANHGNDGRTDGSPAFAQACGLHEKAARHCSPDAHRNVHDRTVSITLKNLSSQPAGNQSNDNPRQEIHTILLLPNPGLTFIHGTFPDFHKSRCSRASPLPDNLRGGLGPPPSKRTD